ncbi:MAG: hypothetical protein ACK56I_27415, partial [bacterium]
MLEREKTPKRVMGTLLKRPFETNPVYAAHKRRVEEKSRIFPGKMPLRPARAAQPIHLTAAGKAGPARRRGLRKRGGLRASLDAVE